MSENDIKPYYHSFHLAILVGGSVLLLGCVVAYLMFVPVPMAPAPVLLEATAAGGGTNENGTARFIVHRAEVAKKMVVDVRTHATRYGDSKDGWVRYGGSTFGAGRSYYNTYHKYGPDGEVVQRTLGWFGPSLMILSTILDGEGTPVTGDVCHFSMRGENLRLTYTQDNRVKMACVAPGVLPGVILEMATDSGEWIQADGPFHFAEQVGTVFVFDCYNRTQPEFMLRARLPASGEEVSFRLANPSPVARSAWTSTPSPTVLRGPECEVELVSFFEYGEPGRNRWRERYDVTSNPDSEQINSAFEVYSLGWQDDIGNDMQGYHGGCPVHPDAKLMKIEFDVGKSNFYKRNFSALPPFASFAWPVTIGGHASTNMVLGAEANRRYFEGVRVRITKRKDGFSCEFEAHSMHPKANLNGLLDLCLFVESDPTHCFFPDGRNSGSHRSKGELFTSAEGRWRVSLDDMPNVGERVTLFVHPGREARGPYSFVVPCEAIVGVRDARSR